MPTIEAVVRTDRAGRYLVQVCRHATAMGGSGGHRHGRHGEGDQIQPAMQAHAEGSDTHGVVTFTPGGRCTLDADAETLRVRIDADDDEALRRIRDIVTGDLARFSHRDPLTLAWRQAPP